MDGCRLALSQIDRQGSISNNIQRTVPEESDGANIKGKRAKGVKQTADLFIFGPPGKFAGKKCHKIVRRCLLLAVCVCTVQC